MQGHAFTSVSAVQHMLGPARPMQALQRLTVSTEDCQCYWPDDWCIDNAGLLAITSSCPQLQHIRFAGSIQPGADLSPLLQLQESCTSLHVGGEAFSDASMPVLLQLRQLQDLT